MTKLFTEPHIRKNILTGEAVLVSPHRTKRPWQGKLEEDSKVVSVKYDENCYLCPGNTRSSNEINPNYKHTYVFNNDFAALKEDTELTNLKSGLLEAYAEKGICKVICFSPNHALTLSKMQISEIEKVIETWQKEYEALGQVSYINNVQIFENRGDVMGCSNPHPHGQIWAQHYIPKEIKLKTSNFSKHYTTHKTTLLQDYLDQEIKEDKRIVFSNKDYVVLVPFWAVWPFETMIIPRNPEKSISAITNETSTTFAEAIKTITSIYDKVFDTPFPYSAGIHQAPTNNETNEGWHWHMSFYPPLLRSASVKKFMVGYEMFAYPQRDITAEAAADLLKSLK